MSQPEQFESTEKEFLLQIVQVKPTHDQSLTPHKRVTQNIQWKFQKTKRMTPMSSYENKYDNKNISFQTDDLEQSEAEEQRDQTEVFPSVFQSKYKTDQLAYRSKRGCGSTWIGKTEHFASIFVKPSIISNSDIASLFNKKQVSPQEKQLTKPFTFNSQFQSGNLMAVYKVGANQYDLILQNDINSQGNTQWFYFNISNIPANTKVKFNIVNMMKSDSLFNYGMQPCVFSEQAHKKIGQGWTRSGTAIKYFKNQNKVDGSRRYYYTLTFTLTTVYQNDVLKVAQSYPYSVQDLKKFLDSLQKKVSKKKSLLKRQSIGQTIGKNDIQVIKVMEQNPRKKTVRELIIVTARQHPGQTPGSFVCQGFLQYITSDEKQAIYLRKNYEIHVLPMLNPDGVLVGNYRTNLCGVDLNRRWDGSKSKLAGQTMLAKKYLLEISKNRDVAFMIDLHGHSRKLYSFFYGNSNIDNPLQVRIFPYMCAKMSQETIRFEDCTFACQEQKLKTARVQLFSKFKSSNVFTFQTSFYGYINKKKQRIHYTPQKLKNLGVVLAKSMFIHERYKTCQECLEALIVKKYLQQLSKKPQLIKCGQKQGSGSQTQPQKGQMNQQQMEKVEGPQQVEQQEQNKSIIKISPKKQISIKDVTKQSRQLQAMNIARVNSIFPNDIIALMPASRSNKFREKQKIVKQNKNMMVQTQQVPLIKIYDMCKSQDNRHQRSLPIRRKILTKNQSQFGPTSSSRSNLFRTVTRPKSSSNPYLETNLFIPMSNRINKNRHESEMQIRGNSKNKVPKGIQTSITFPPEADFMTKTLANLTISPITKGLQIIKRKTNFATITPDLQSFGNKPSSQNFKIGLRALNVQTWRIKKKNLQ